MKKNFKVLFGFLLLFFTILNVNAEESYSIVIKNDEPNHTYEAYQIFTGDLSNDENTLSNIVWGSGVDYSFTNLSAKEYAESITTTNAREKATELGSHLTNVIAGSTSTQENGEYKITGLSRGYYLIKDKDNSLTNSYDSYTEYIVRLVSDVEVKPKSGKPVIDKKIVEDEKVVYSTKYKVGDTITYELTGTLPTNYDNFTNYKYVFHDVLSSGLTLDENSIEVYVDDVKITSGYSTLVSEENNETLLDIEFSDTKLVDNITKNSVIKVLYNALVNESAIKGLNGNINTLTLEYSNNPYTDEVGISTEVVTKVYLFDFIFNKLDSVTNDPLNGAGFKLEKLIDGDYQEIETITHTDSNVFEFTGLSTGEYRLTETTTPDGYNTLNPILFTITSELDETGLISLDGTTLSFTASLEDGTLVADILNVKGVELPLTGGSGTLIFTITGISLIALSLVGFILTKKRNN